MTVYGTPLKQSHPAEVEKFILDKIRADIGKELMLSVELRPTFEIERAPGDLSGDLTNAYGTIEVRCGKEACYVPFMIVDKTLSPFEVIRKGKQEVGYAPERMRNIIQNLLLKRDEADDDAELVKREDVTSNNGFLGTVMTIRDDENMKNMYGQDYRQDGFGVLDQARLFNKRAENVDTFDILEKVAETIEGATFISNEEVERFLDHVEKEAAEAPYAFEMDKTAAYEEEKAKRAASIIADTRLVNYDRHRSGNNVLIPILDQQDTTTHFENVQGRVYTKFASLLGSKITLDGLVVTSGRKYRVLQKGNRLMTYRDQAPTMFEPHDVRVRSLQVNRLYTMEQEEDTAVVPFRIKDSFVKSFRNHYTVGQSDTKVTSAINDPNTVFQDLMSAQEYSAIRPVTFGILVTDLVKEPTYRTFDQLAAFIDQHAKNEDDHWLAKMMIKTFPNERFVLMPSDALVIDLVEPLKHTYDKPESLVSNEMLSKSAAYQNQNKLILRSEGYRKPERFTVEWSFIESNGKGPERTEKLRRSTERGLSKDAANNLLLLLGSTHAQTKMMFLTIRRTGQQSIVPLPDYQKARDLARDEMGRKEKMRRKQSLLSRTLNNQTFGRDLSNVVAFGVATAIDTAGGGDSMAKLDSFMKQSASFAGEMEKIATGFKGEQWMELAVLANVKHRLDKVACAIESGHYVSDADDVFDSVRPLLPQIEKIAKELIPYNRLQHTSNQVQQVDASIIKEAQDMLDVLYGYATLEKQAHVVSDMGQSLKNVALQGKKKVHDFLNPFESNLKQADAHVESTYADYLESAVEHGSGQAADSSRLMAAQDTLRDAYQGRTDVLQQQAQHDGKLRGVALLGASGVALPGAAGYIGYQSQQERDPRV